MMSDELCGSKGLNTLTSKKTSQMSTSGWFECTQQENSACAKS